MKLVLDSGRSISLSTIHQSGTYAGMLLGRPDAESNERKISELLRYAAKIIPGSSRPYLVPPKVMARDLMGRDGETIHEERMPGLYCVGEFSSYGFPDPDSDPVTCLTVVWFQDEFAMPIAPGVLDHIRKIDWEANAKEYNW